MYKPRIAIRAFTCRRDVASATLLAHLLEVEGCDVLVTSTRDFEATLRLWKPHVAVVNTPGQARRVKTVAPEVQVAFLDGEGFLPDESSHALQFSRDIELFRAMDLVLLWGGRVRNEIVEALPSEKQDHIHLVGHPAYDLIRFRPETARYDSESTSIGVVMRFNSINYAEGTSLIRTLANPGNLERIGVQCQAFVGLVNCIRALLQETDFRISIRPHPLEQIDSYQAYKARWFGSELAGRVEIDDSLSFPYWAVRQRAILSPTSTSLIEAYLLKVPVVNVDALCGTDEYNRDYAEMSHDWQAAGLSPQTIPDLMELLQKKLPEVTPNSAIERQLVEYCDFDKDRSAALMAAQHIVRHARQSVPPRGARLPTFIVDLMDRIRFYKACRRNPLHSNMNYRRGYHALPADLDEIVQNILRSSGTAPRHWAAEVDNRVRSREKIVDA